MTLPERGPLDRVLVLIPTYNEKDNLPRIVGRVRASVPAADILILDDNSPDGTGAIADGLAASDPQVHVPVSYTHLDVYKRQRMPCSWLALA